MPRDRDARFSIALLERYQRSETALVSALGEMYVQGVSTRKLKAVTQELCGHALPASTVSQINKGLDVALARSTNRPLEESYPDLILDARYEKVRLNGVIRSQAVLIAIGINWQGRRQVLAVELTPPRVTDWAEQAIGETLTFYMLPRQHHKHLKSTNLLERLNEEIKRRPP